MKENNDLMGWNPPTSGPNGSKDQRPKGDDGEPMGSSERNNDNDPWNRRRNNEDGVDAIFKKFESFLGKKKSGGMGNFKSKNNLKGLLFVIAAVLIGIYIFMGFYTVREAERGVVLRFGKFYETVEPGLQWKLSGIDKVYTVDIEQVRSIQSSGAMLTEDENVVIVEMDVQYRISDPVQYLFSVTNPDNSLLEATDSALRYVVGHTLMDDILTSGRELVRQNTRELLSSIIEPYKMGLSIVDVNFLPARAPDEVKEAFDDAIAAQEDEQRFKREAEAYANEVLPRAEGQVQRIRQQSEAYRSQVVLDAQGQVARFEQILPEYNAAPQITRTRLYLETMQEVLGKSQKVILDTKDGQSPLLYLPLPEPKQSFKSVTPPMNLPSSNATTSSSSSSTTPYYPRQQSTTQTSSRRSGDRAVGYSYSQGVR